MYLTATQLAKRWGLHRNTIYTALRDAPETLPRHFRIRRTWRFPLNEVEDFESREQLG